MIHFGKPLDFPKIRAKLAKITDTLSPWQKDITAVILFGSVARYAETPLSDVDLAVLYDSTLAPEQIEEVHKKVYDAVWNLLAIDDFDLICLNDAPLRVRYGAIRDCEILVLNDREKYVEFLEVTVKHFLDFRPVRQELDRALVNALAGG